MAIRESTKIKYRGRKYGHMTIIDVIRSDPNNKHHYFVKCLCDCGTEKEVRLSGLQQGTTVSCGCFGKENRKKINTGNTYARKSLGENARHTLYSRYKLQAKKRNIPFDLTFNDFISLTTCDCFYCGVKPEYVLSPPNGYGHHIYNGIDRVDNSKGYTRSNCVAACRKCNSVKNAITLDMVIKIYEFLFPRTLPFRVNDA